MQLQLVAEVDKIIILEFVHRKKVKIQSPGKKIVDNLSEKFIQLLIGGIKWFI